MGSGTVMSWPFSSFFSHSIRKLTPSTTESSQETDGRILTSDLPRRSLLEMSKVSPTAAVSTPPVPRFCSRRLSRILEKRASCGAVYGFIVPTSDGGLTRRSCGAHLTEVGQAHVHARPEARAQVGGAGEDVAQTLVPHELPASLLDQVLHL
uniref:Uncharacterized protein n=1 Tax=Oryzias melastigma TaxID=30732 RepID=A0A3B3CU41_ORYME